MQTADYWIHQLKLTEHPEGGYFGEVYKSSESIAASALPQRFKGSRSLSTSIYFLVKNDRFSAFHRLQADEVWHFYTGSPLTIYMIMPDGRLRRHYLGPDFEHGQNFQAVVTAGCWFGAATEAKQAGSYTLVGCTVAPGFDFADFELGNPQVLLSQYPQHREIIRALSRE